MSIFLGQLLCGNTKNTWKLKLLSCLLFFYWLGGLASYYAARAWGVWSLSFSAAVYFSLFAGLALHLYRSLHTPILTAIAGLYSWQRLALQTNISDNDGSIDMVLLKQAFEKIDIDGDGFVTLDELCEYLVQCKSGRYNSKAMFEIADRDKKSLLSFQDWKNVLCKEI